MSQIWEKVKMILELSNIYIYMLHLNLKEARLDPRQPSSPQSSMGAGEGAWISSGGVVSPPHEVDDREPEPFFKGYFTFSIIVSARFFKEAN